jgi:hypothetical protein
MALHNVEIDTPNGRGVSPWMGDTASLIEIATGRSGIRVVLKPDRRALGDRRLDELTPSEIRQQMAYVKAHVVQRRNARGGRSAQEHLVAALRCLYRCAVEDGLIAEADDPARKVAKPRRLPSTRRAVLEIRLAEINQIAATTGDDPELDTLLLRLHTETACRRGGALALRPADLDPEQCLVLLREKGETVRWQPVSPLSWPAWCSMARTGTPCPAGSCCGMPTGGRSRPAGMTTCGPGSAGTCRGCGRSRSACTGSGTPP